MISSSLSEGGIVIAKQNKYIHAVQVVQNVLLNSLVVQQDFTCLLMYGRSFAVSNASYIHSLRDGGGLDDADVVGQVLPGQAVSVVAGPPVFLCVVRRRDGVVVVAPV